MTREEAIKVVKSAAVYTPKEIEALETLIPGFTQSEDDRILNALITHIRIYEGDFTTVGITRSEILDYLERLKKHNARQRLAEWSKTEEGKAKYEEVANDMRKMIGEEQKPTATINGEPISTENQTVNVGDDETEVQKAYREGKNAGRKEVFDHPEYYGLQPRRMYDYDTGKRNPEWSEEDEEALDMCVDAIPKAWKTKSGILLTKWLKEHLGHSWKPIEAPTKEELYILKWLATNVLCDDMVSREAAKRLLSLYDKIKNI